MNSNLSLYQPSDESIVVYKSNDGIVQLDVQVSDETVWLTLDNSLCCLIGISRSYLAIYAIFMLRVSLQERQLLQKMQRFKIENGNLEITDCDVQFHSDDKLK